MRPAIRIHCAAIAATLVLVPGAGLATDLVIHAGVLLDGISAKPQQRMSIIVHDDKIVAVRAEIGREDCPWH
jgi:hypothetical protein